MEYIYIVREINDLEYGGRKNCAAFKIAEAAKTFISKKINERTSYDAFDKEGNYTFWDGHIEPWYTIEVMAIL